MNKEQFEQLKEEMREHTVATIERVVNGKIDRLTHKLDEYIEDDMEWKAEAQPLVDAFKGGSWFMKTLIAVLKFLGLLTVGAGFIKLTADYFNK